METAKSKRLDVILVERGFFPSREKARASIMAGDIFVDGQRVDKCGQRIKESSHIEFKGNIMPYVSRGGLKLEKAIKSFNIHLNGKVCMDIGASTGGFTDCMLQNGAKKVFAVDVGYGQFAWKLRTDPRVICMERTNARYLTTEDINDYPDFASIDVSFISLKKIVPPIINLLTDKGGIVALIKPQFEAGRDKIGKKGVVKEASTHKEVINDILRFLLENNQKILGLEHSPIKGPEGNIEYLVYFTKDQNCKADFDFRVVDFVVDSSHKNL
ncbi:MULTISPECIES: TlyA family RNA methyltransferase [Clostridium]|uniref:Hemolysin A n=2 Tax=Clostridium TaxID=1485 RepID=A0A151AQF2_9CLOT|nr:MULTISPECIES: TlyA family RNA methyltransferase [Clostridium]MBE6078981.1 TlyA family RNA methyltransferase [Clostridium lundense]KYH29823.1 hemolysin A [Clostridium colicanis DSM 13634]MBE6042718.1 TlyA family RNA methyltransferase [Clostridium thermopalmarium]PRR75204.1 Hemolysin A [Clostridium thermopalmarium DSM 5974]PVZ27960.1 23S rRNA (cytidine1920-2'-O)/16S rRNA (cytidine1409-2'-O)-methyltransferase [Clostridium thermopalmarium DSM 5974]